MGRRWAGLRAVPFEALVLAILVAVGSIHPAAATTKVAKRPESAKVVKPAKLSTKLSKAGAKAKPSVAFVVSCRVSHEATDDPIVHPGHRGASHRHTFFGNTSTNAASTVKTLRAASKTTCDNSADLASYWAPSPRSGSWTHMRAYYDAGPAGTDQSEIVAYPFGLTMVAGYNANGGVAAVAWSCNRSIDGSGWSSTPPKPCAGNQPMTVRVEFPQCWDGKRLRAEKGTHLAGRVGANCPNGHRVMLPRLRLVFTLNSSQAPESLSIGGLKSMHADFFNVWREQELEALIDLCIRGHRQTSSDLRRCRTRAGEPTPL